MVIQDDFIDKSDVLETGIPEQAAQKNNFRYFTSSV